MLRIFIMKKYFLSILIINVLVLSLPGGLLAQGIDQPKTMEEAESLGMKILTALPSAVKKVWQEETLPFLLKMWNWAKNIWDNYIGYKVENLWKKFLNLLGKESPDIKKEFQKEKEEMQKDLWQRFKDLLK